MHGQEQKAYMTGKITGALYMDDNAFTDTAEAGLRHFTFTAVGDSTFPCV